MATRGALSVCKLEAVLLTATEKEWALNGQSVERQQSENASEIVQMRIYLAAAAKFIAEFANSDSFWSACFSSSSVV